MSAAKLYTPQILALAVELHEYPLTNDLPLRGAARSPACGSTLSLGLRLSGDEIAAIGLRLSACAIGQASAAIFARHVVGRTREQLLGSARAMEDWLTENADRPDWPDLALLEPARAYPGRHGAMLLPWKAAIDALSNSQAAE
ncbi:iron-sulfur cluster assembly scaffold protein [Erythrobacter sp. 3-20A1M]|uniref:iron-sulfur cluster assembly scaffold protein n=1 Tax=Erythrobacter sp. 3-20A1M TaxID=2653850 RepID=UPI001BFC4AB1|nr:iron-sulfur cluster assembly scaffold protein [Erythrobacter sp. 3-20A1M]QWC58157.1 iron-sulfur cluster assembly scaffold protein [Erythrobacter sp. 3-20A1M]